MKRNGIFGKVGSIKHTENSQMNKRVLHEPQMTQATRMVILSTAVNL